MRLRSVAAVALAVAGTVLAVPASAVEWVTERAYVPTKHGDIYVEVVRPATGKAPVVMTMSPDGDLRPLQRGLLDSVPERYREQGYALARADVVGTGYSGGCHDHGGPAEAESGAAVVEWLGTRPWSTGKVGMLGSRESASLQLAVATLAPRHLAAIVPHEPVSSRYDQHFDHAVPRHDDDGERGTVDGPAVSPNPYRTAASAAPGTDPGRASAATLSGEARERAAGCETGPALRAHVVRPEYDAYWRARDWASRAGQVRAAVLFWHGWLDTAYPPAGFTRYWQGLRRAADKRAVLGQWRLHRGQDGGVVFPIDPDAYVDAFFARHLKGIRDPRLDRVPKVLTEANDRRFRTTLPLGAARTALSLTRPMAGGTGSFVNSGTETSSSFQRDPSAQLGFASYAFPVTRDTRLAGSGEVTLRLTSSLPRGQVAVTLLDLPPEATAARVVTLGLLDLRFRDSLAAAKDVPVGTPFTARVTLRPQDYVLEKGHRLVVAVAGSESTWGVPDPVAGQRISVLGGSVARLPLVDAAAGLA